MDVTDLSATPAFQPPPPTIVSVPAPDVRSEDGPVRGYLVVGRLGLGHTLHYLFLGGAVSLDRVEAMVRSQPNIFPGDVVVVDLGESYGSYALAEHRAGEMRRNLPEACGFTLGELTDDHPTRA